MQIEVAKSAGFCFGVDRAVNMVNELLEQGRKVCTLGPIIHNKRLVAELSSKGTRIIENPSEAHPFETVVIRSHGVASGVLDEIKKISGSNYVNATCPFVEKIQKLVFKAPEGSTVLIAGDWKHPEVQGITGHCKIRYYTFETQDELKQITESTPEIVNEPVIVVAQTTFNTEIWEKCNDFIKKVYTNARIFDTICSATSIRQKEAKEIAARSDLMLVIGGRNSSNTSKLLSVCAAYCPSFLIEGASELPVEPLKKADKVGVTAGASTPACIIKEVLIAMADLDNMDNEDISFAEALEKSFKTVSTDDTVRGLVVGMSLNEVQVDLGTKHAGYIPLSELTDDSAAKPEQLVKVGDELDLVVMRVNDQDGTVMLSKKRFDALKGWDDIVKASEDGTVMEGVVTDVVKGGILASVQGVRVFIPASQSGVSRDEKLDMLLHQNVRLLIIEINKGRKRAVGSIRQVLREERKKQAETVWNEIEEGKEYTGVVKSLTSYGAFVDLGGVDGMIHVSELSWSRIRHPSEVVNVGDTVNVFVKSFDKEAKKISLGYKDKGEDPWAKFLSQFKVGDIVDAKIVSFMPFGSFAQIIPGVDGLIHISQIADKHIAKPQDVLQMGEVVKVKIIEIDEEKKRISLSIREAQSEDTNGDEETDFTESSENN
ncbi:MAG TPA: bifunctional 4-hydroxy-3-methylbut-2-enyl diphosphate reductase/30S ribosomal protein S1 [Ruminiclostridium sp.]|nr:bifunctional 4-hydroxy-3-methylbut-2-enyl diphosphate reductase/30S ribosomal protein S1 [Ruminiclostridium sp.]